MATPLLDAHELGRVLGISARTVREYANRGRIPEITISRKVRRFNLAEVLEALKARGSEDAQVDAGVSSDRIEDAPTARDIGSGTER